ncbi:MAG: hypothetical protein DRJ15_16480 [Bacteroidetes bacterium]|nr:MAG: hypothetical protein DRJ15_16480 [Bacteroidota bacterium]
MVDERIQFPAPAASPFTDAYGQIWIWNDVAWVRRGLEPGVPEVIHTDGRQFARVGPSEKPNPNYPNPLNPDEPVMLPLPPHWEAVQADEWYLGPYDTSPTVDNYGLILQEGHTYYDTNTHTMMVWDSVEWDAFSGVSEIATLWEFRWDSLGDRTAPFKIDVHNGDDHNNIPFDAWVRGLIVISLFKNGVRLIERRALTPSYGEGLNASPGRPADEENQIELADYGTILLTYPTGPVPPDPTVSFLALDTNFSWWWDGSLGTYVRGGAELSHYDYWVDYDAQEVHILHDAVKADSFILETKTLAASQYIKSTQDNASEWDFVSQDCELGGANPSTGLLPSETAIQCYVAAAVQEAEKRATNAMIGATFDFAGPIPPANALECTNGIVSNLTYPLLFAAIGHTWDTFAGAPAPVNPAEFRLPPNHLNGQPVYYGGSGGENTPGDYLENTNRAHSHSASHTHNGATQSAGNHRHGMMHGVSNDYDYPGKKNGLEDIKKDERKYTEYAGAHVHGLSIDTANVTTSIDGTGTAKPDTAIVLKCIWADIQP